MNPWHECNLEDARKHRQRQLSLSYGDLDAVPEAVRDLHWLESLDISANQIRSLPAWLGEFTGLREIIAFANPIMEGPRNLPICADWSVIERLGVPDERIRGVALDWDLVLPPERFLRLAHLLRLDLGRHAPDLNPPPWIALLLTWLSGEVVIEPILIPQHSSPT